MPAVIDVTVAFNPKIGHEPTVFNMLNGKPVVAYLLMRRIPIEEIPEDDVKAAEWLHELYRHKDQCLDNFFRDGEFNLNKDLKGYENFKYIELPRRIYSLANIVIWACLVLFPLVYFIGSMVLSGSYTQCTIAIVLVALGKSFLI